MVDLAEKKIIRGPIHSYVGQEAVAVGVLSNSKKTGRGEKKTKNF